MNSSWSLSRSCVIQFLKNYYYYFVNIKSSMKDRQTMNLLGYYLQFTKIWDINAEELKYNIKTSLKVCKSCDCDFLCSLIFFLNTRYPVQEPTNPRGPILPPTCGGPVKSQSMAPHGLSLPKLTSKEIEPETLWGAHVKIASQPLGQPQMRFFAHYW